MTCTSAYICAVAARPRHGAPRARHHKKKRSRLSSSYFDMTGFKSVAPAAAALLATAVGPASAGSLKDIDHVVLFMQGSYCQSLSLVSHALRQESNRSSYREPRV